MKICRKCGNEKELSEFSKDKKGKFGVKGCCKLCIKNYDNKHYFDNSDKIKKYSKQWRIDNPKYFKEWKDEKGNIYFKEYYNNNKDKFIKSTNKYNKKKRLEDPFYKLKQNIRTKISQSLKGYSKSKTTLQILGVDNFDVFKQHIESQFQKGMNWQNYGLGENKWVIDHRIPVNSAKTEQEIYAINHYSNLQPMWSIENMKKGTNIL